MYGRNLGRQQRDASPGQYFKERRLGHVDSPLLGPGPHRPHQRTPQLSGSAQTARDGRRAEEDPQRSRLKGESVFINFGTLTLNNNDDFQVRIMLFRVIRH